MRSVTIALSTSMSKPMFSTRPIVTPDIETGAPTFRPPMLSYCAFTR
jgi:hypothetical protein